MFAPLAISLGILVSIFVVPTVVEWLEGVGDWFADRFNPWGDDDDDWGPA